MKKNVLIIGASDKSERYSNKAMKMLLDHGHNPVLYNPNLDSIDGKKVYQSLSCINEKIDVVTVYVNQKILSGIIEDVISLKPQKIIFNPGTESSEIYKKLNDIAYEEACTLVLLSTGQEL